LSVLKEKPAFMLDSDFFWLKSLHFGGIVFGNPFEGDTPLPGKIAQGDLDGDLYFVCWNKEILSFIESDAGAFLPSPSKGDESAKFLSWSDNWLHDGQDLMRDVHSLTDHDTLMRKLYKLWQELFTGSTDDARDATDAGLAYKQSFDIGKHGRQVDLPAHLWDRLPVHLHRYLTPNENFGLS
jgi:hypothetical protein